MSSSQRMGLLQKANLLSQKKGLAFCEFIQKNNISKAAVFNFLDGYFYIQNSYGLDGVSIISSKSTQDFWTGLLPEKSKIYYFSKDDESLNSLLQFFSFNLKDSIDCIYAVRTGTKIYLICNSQIDESIFNDFYTIENKLPEIDFNKIEFNKNSIFRNYSINIEDSVISYLNNKNEDHNLFKDSLLNEIINTLFFLFSENHLLSYENNLLNVSINSSFDIPEVLLKEHIYQTIKSILETSSKIITVSSKGTAESIVELKKFLKAE